METLFLFSALIGGTFLVCQFVMTLFGLSEADSHPDLNHDFTGSGDLHVEGDLEQGDQHHSSWLFGIISFRTLTAAATFFGMTGMLVNRSGGDVTEQLLVAIISGGAALFGVHWMMQTFYQLGESGNLRMTNAVGQIATVNVTIPPNRAGRGKVSLQIQGRLEELAAMSCQSLPIPTGSHVQIVGLISGNVLEVEPVPIDQPSTTPTA